VSEPEPIIHSHLTAGRTIRYVLRVLWIAVRLAAVVVLIDKGSTFFYQGF
jgi:hypothetical protein